MFNIVASSGINLPDIQMSTDIQEPKIPLPEWISSNVFDFIKAQLNYCIGIIEQHDLIVKEIRMNKKTFSIVRIAMGNYIDKRFDKKKKKYLYYFWTLGVTINDKMEDGEILIPVNYDIKTNVSKIRVNWSRDGLEVIKKK